MLTLGVGKAGMRNAAEALSKDPECANLRIAYVNIDAHIIGNVNREIADYYWQLCHEPLGDRAWDLNYIHEYEHNRHRIAAKTA